MVNEVLRVQEERVYNITNGRKEVEGMVTIDKLSDQKESDPQGEKKRTAEVTCRGGPVES